MKFKLTLRKIIIGVVIVLLVLLARPVSFLIYTYYKDKDPAVTKKNNYTNDASSLNETKVDSIVKVPGNINESILQIAQLIKQAARQNKKISIAGAQHSMGGHTIYRDAIVLDMKTLHFMKYDSIKNTLLVGSGALWSEIIPYLDKIGKSVAVMQSNNSFSVGGSVSVNCHGWQPNSAPIASTVESFRLMNAEGTLLNCNRDENKELFSLVLGGYGLFGVIIDVELKVVDNRMYKARQYVIKADDYISQFDQLVKKDATVGMAYGRININPDHFMEEAILSVYRVDPTTALQPVKENGFNSLRRTVFRSSVNSAYGKDLRWKTEKMAARLINGKKFSRNQLLNEGVDIYQNTDTAYTDILHEYFIPGDSVIKFIAALKKIIPRYKADLLNITVRNVKKDDDTFLAYAHEEVFGFVMLFNQAKDTAAENEMRSLTQNLVDAATALKGTYYLPYRLHATKEQMHRAYPMAKDFFRLKKKYDPAELFQSRFYEAYK